MPSNNPPECISCDKTSLRVSKDGLCFDCLEEEHFSCPQAAARHWEDKCDQLKAENERIKSQVLGYRAGEHMSWTIERWQRRAEAWKLAAESCADIVSTDAHSEIPNAVALWFIKAARALEQEKS